MKSIITIFLTFFLLSSCISDETNRKNQESVSQDNQTVTLIFGGDVMHHMPQMTAAFDSETQTLDYRPGFQFVKPYIESADLAICNLETVFAGKPYSGYPQFSSPDELLYALKDTGFDILQLANNHILDKGSRGLERTIQLIQENGIYSIGAYINKDHRDKYYPPIYTVKGVKIAFLNYTYSTNGLTVNKPNIVNRLDSVQIIKDIHYSRERGADIIVAMAHWGQEYRLESDSTQCGWTGFLVRNQVDVIIGSHPHVVQNAEIKVFEEKKIPIFYSVGNLISNQRKLHQNGGIFAKIEINPENKRITNISYVPFYVYKGYLQGKNQYYLIPTADYLSNSLILDLPPSNNYELTTFHYETTNRLNNIPVNEHFTVN
ncbi:MAG: CapA family protein [Paludibacteraceae bacterium]